MAAWATLGMVVVLAPICLSRPHICAPELLLVLRAEIDVPLVPEVPPDRIAMEQQHKTRPRDAVRGYHICVLGGWACQKGPKDAFFGSQRCEVSQSIDYV